MRYLLKKIFILWALPLLITFLFSGIKEAKSQEHEPPAVILNDQKIIFSKKPILDEEGWLFPLEEIASKLQDKISIDLLNGTITIQRTRDKSTVQLNTKNGVVAINNRPFKTLFGYNRIILSSDSQMVPTSALVILLGLTSYDTEENKLILKNTIGTEANNYGTVQPQKRTGLKDLLVDYLTVTHSFNWLQTSDLYSRRTEINSGFHNDNYALTSDLITKSGTDAPPLTFDSGNFSFYKNASPFQVHVGDKPLSLIKSPLLGGITVRGIQIQTAGPLKDSRFIFGSGFLPSNGKVLGKGLSFVKYGRLAEVSEWSTSPKKDWQFSIGEAAYTDSITNQLVRSKQSGGLLALSATKTGKYIEGDCNIAVGTTKDKISGKSGSGPGADLLIRFKPKSWISLFTKGAYYSPNFFNLSGNPYYHDRNEGTFGININPPRSNLGLSHSVGEYNLNSSKPNTYGVTNIFASTTPIKKGPTIITSYSQNNSQVSSTRAIDNLLFPINQSNIGAVDLETLIERRTNSFFRTSLLKNWRTVNLTSSINYFTFANSSPLKAPILGEKSVTKLLTYDFNINKSLNNHLAFQNYIQGSELYKQVRFGIRVGPILDKKLNFLLQTGALLQADKNPSPIFGLNLNYQLNKKNLFSFNLDKTAFLTNISALWQYNLRPYRQGNLPQIGEEQAIGRIAGKVIVLEEAPKNESQINKIILPGINRERGLANVRIHLGNYIINTDQTGSFEFPSLTTGIHRLKIEYSDVPSYLTSITPEAVDIKVEPGKETKFNFVLAYFGSVTGKLLLENEPRVQLEEEPELQDIRVYLDGTDFETLTNLDGSFVLGDVKPGKYKVKVDPDFLPKELEADQKDIEIEVNAKGKVENIQLPIKFKSKPQEIKEF
ncbi:MAG: hypothetical protein HY094_06610 [Candidatus Melainabacteria bacterium]|nr:hypothetical protein [Candidatus Melainabacteria bacterium]